MPVIVPHCSSPHLPNKLTWIGWQRELNRGDKDRSKNREGVTKWVSVVWLSHHSEHRIRCAHAHDVKVTWKYNPEVTRTRTSYCKSPAGCVKYVHDALVFCHLSSWILCLLYHHLSMYIYALYLLISWSRVSLSCFSLVSLSWACALWYMLVGCCVATYVTWCVCL